MLNTPGPTAMLAVGLALGGAMPPVAANDPSPEIRERLEAVLRAKTAHLEDESSADGLTYRRGTYSKQFAPAGDGGYEVTYIKDAPAPERLHSDRYRLTLLEDDAGRWGVTGETLEGRYSGLIRTVPGDETFHRFESLRIEREGLQITAGPGTAFIDYLQGRPHQLILTADDLAYAYVPPGGRGAYRHAILVDDKRGDLVFEPTLVRIDCVPGSCEGFLEGDIRGLASVERGGLSAELTTYCERWLARERRERDDDPFRGFRRAPEPGRPRYTVSVKRRDEHWVHLRYDTWAPDEVQFGVTDFGAPLYAYPSAATVRRGVDAYEIERREDLAAQDYDLRELSGTIELALADDELVVGDLRLRLRTRRFLSELPFSFQDLTQFVGRPANDRNPAVTIDALQDADGRDLTWVRLGTAGGLVVFPEELPPDTEIELAMRFRNRGSILQITPSYSYMDRSGWLPFVRFDDPIETFDLTVRAPARYKVLGVGTRVEDRTEGDVNITRWRSEHPVRFPTLIFGDYVVDRPRTVAKKFDGTEIPVTIHVDRYGMTSWGIRPKQLQPLAEQAVNALNIYRTLFGVDYPYGKLDLVNDFRFYGGQGPSSIIYLGNGAFRSSTTLSNFLRDQQQAIFLSRVLVAHEVAHQWWGASIGAVNAKSYWFVEALAEYSAALFAEIVESDGFRHPERGKKAYQEQVARWRGIVLNREPIASVQDASTLWSDNGYLAAVYAKGPYTFHMLRTTFGDEKFFEFLNRLGQQLAGRSIVGRDIQRIAESSLGGLDEFGDPYRVDLEWFFDQWIRGIGIPEYSFRHRLRQSEDGKYVVEGTIVQRVLAGPKKRELPGVGFRAMVPITVLGTDKQEYGTQVLVDGPSTPFQFKVPVKPLEVALNRDGAILAYDVIEPD